MDSIINELYYGNIRPVEQMGGLTAEAAAIMKRVHKNEDRLEECLDKQEKELLHAIQDDRLEVASIIEEKRFREAFILEARLMAEILTGGPQKLRGTPCNFWEGNSVNNTKSNKYNALPKGLHHAVSLFFQHGFPRLFRSLTVLCLAKEGRTWRI